MRRPLISGNWKMHKNHFEALESIQKLAYYLTKDDYELVDVSVHPPFTDIRTVQTWIESEKLKMLLGAQNCYWAPEGAYTGEVAASMLAKMNVSYVIVGHSERREYFGETDENVNRKSKAVFENGMTPIICVGETLAEKEADGTEAKVERQVKAALKGLPTDQVSSLVMAYEPIWAIGTGRTASPDDAQTVCKLMRSLVGAEFGEDVAEAVRIQYGGSVKPDNAKELMSQRDIDGALVGGASLDPEAFARIVQYRLR